MKRIQKIIELLEDWLAGILIVSGLLLLFYNVLLRYVFEAQTSWQSEVAIYLVVWGALFGASATLRENGHIRVDIVYNLLPPRFQRGVDIFANLVSLVFCAFLFISGLNLVYQNLLTGQTSLSGFPLWSVYIIIPFTGFILVLRLLERLIRLLRGKSESDSNHDNVASGGVKI